MTDYCGTQKIIFWIMLVTKQFVRTENTMEVKGNQNSAFHKVSQSYRFGTTWGWKNYDKIFIFVWAIPLNKPHDDKYTLCVFHVSFAYIFIVNAWINSGRKICKNQANTFSCQYTWNVHTHDKHTFTINRVSAPDSSKVLTTIPAKRLLVEWKGGGGRTDGQFAWAQCTAAGPAGRQIEPCYSRCWH